VVVAAPLSLKPTAVDRTLAALADPHRRAVVDLLRVRPRAAGDLAQALGLAAPTMSRHLRVLREGGLVAQTHPEFDARVRVYALRQAPMDELRDWLAAAETLWIDQLASFKAHLETDSDRPTEEEDG
jgi:DNA-binding transcriptional ArsR family regulator